VADNLEAGKAFGTMLIEVRFRALEMTSEEIDTAATLASPQNQGHAAVEARTRFVSRRRGTRARNRALLSSEEGHQKEGQLTTLLVPQKERSALLGPARD
jgi:hypothetical protein